MAKKKAPPGVPTELPPKKLPAEEQTTFAPQPSQVPAENPQGASMSDEDVAAAFASMSDEDVAGAFAQLDQSAAPAMDDAAIAEQFAQAEYADPLPAAAPTELAPDAMNPDTGADIKARAKASFGRNLAEEFKIYEKYYGAGNVKLDPAKNKILFRKSDKEKFKAVDGKMFSNVTEFLADLADMSGIGADTVLGVVSDIGAKLIATPTAAVGGAVAGTAAGPGGTLAGGGAGAAAGYVAGSYGGAFAQAYTRERMAEEMLEGPSDPNYSENQEAIINGSLNLVMMGLGGVGKRAFHAAADAFNSSQANRIAMIASLRRGLDKLAEGFGAVTGTTGQLGKRIAGDALEEADDGIMGRIHKDLGAAVQAVDNQVYAASVASGKRVKPMQTLQAMQQLLEAVGARKVSGVVPKGEPGMAMAEAGPLLFDTAGVDLLPGAKDVLKSKNGVSVIKDLVQDFNELSMLTYKGGVPPEKFFNRIRYWQSEAKFDKDLATPDIQALYKRLQHAGVKDRADYAQQVLDPNSEAGKLFTAAYSDYSKKIGPLEQIRQLYQQTGSAPERFVEAIIEPKNSTRLRQFKQLFGASSPEFRELKTHWLMSQIDKRVSPSTGLFNAEAFLNDLKSYGDDVMGELVTKEEFNRMKHLAYNLARVPTSDLTSQQVVDRSGDAIQLVAAGNSWAGARLLTWLFQSRKEAADYLANEGYKHIRLPKGITSDEELFKYQLGMNMRKILVQEYRPVTPAGKAAFYAKKTIAPTAARRATSKAATEGIMRRNDEEKQRQTQP